ncbi:hypothetical protein HQ571_00255 [Candidatus Kuenenbacteria bacterium]|nr:hypothetical protein [Candidatus Kuenenbacteria bacterium]
MENSIIPTKMKWLLAVLLVVVGVIALSGTQLAKNTFGTFLGVGSCPNCNTTWNETEHGSVPYKKAVQGVDFNVQIENGTAEDIGLKSASGTYGVMLCNECLDHPERLNTTQIHQHLLDHGWSKDDAEAAKIAIEQYKQEKSEETNLALNQ